MPPSNKRRQWGEGPGSLELRSHSPRFKWVPLPQCRRVSETEVLSWDPPAENGRRACSFLIDHSKCIKRFNMIQEHNRSLKFVIVVEKDHVATPLVEALNAAGFTKDKSGVASFPREEAVDFLSLFIFQPDQLGDMQEELPSLLGVIKAVEGEAVLDEADEAEILGLLDSLAEVESKKQRVFKC